MFQFDSNNYETIGTWNMKFIMSTDYKPLHVSKQYL
jgi:hypothetical protein